MDQVLDRLLEASAPIRPAIVAVDGRSASGKSTLAARVAARHGAATVVHTDDVAWYLSFFDWDRELAGHVLEPVRQGLAVRYRPAAWDERARDGAVEVPAGIELVLVEGVGSSRGSLVPLLDAAVWVQSDDVRARTRGLARDGGDPDAIAFWDAWDREERPFLERDRPWTRARLIAWGTPSRPHDPEHEMFVVAGPLG